MSSNISLTTNAIYEFYNIMEENNVVMIYEGEFNQDITKTVLSMTENSFQEIGIDVSIRKKIFNVMVEMLQNICKHQYNEYSAESNALFLVGDDQDDFFIVSGNVIHNGKLDLVKSNIDKVNSLSKIELKEFYKETRLQSTISSVGGAGLGFIDMARKSGKKIEYDFKQLTLQYSFFSQLTRISKTDIND